MEQIKRGGAVVLVLGLVMLSLCCQKDREADRYTVEVVEGIKIIRNFPDEGNAAPRLLEIQVDLSIGEEAGDDNYMFTYPVDIDADSSGSVYVLDYQECLIRKYDSRGQHVKNIGRPGEGPAEFTRPSQFCISRDDKVFVLDWGVRKIEVLDSEGEHVRDIRVESPDRLSAGSSDELFIGHSFFREGKAGAAQRVYRVGRYDEEREDISAFFEREQERTARLSDGEFSVDYPNFIRWDMDSTGNVFLGAADRYEIFVFSPQGGLQFKIGLERKPVPITGDAKQKISDILSRLSGILDSQEMQRIQELLETYPVFKSISVDEAGRIWVEHYAPYWRDKPKTETVFDIFSSEGIYQFTAVLQMAVFPQLVFRNGFLYTLTADESGYARAVRLRILEEFD